MEFRTDQPARPVDFHDHREGQPRPARPKAAEVVGELLGQHGQGQVGKIDARPADQGVAVHGRTRPDIVRDVGDVDAQEEIAGGQPLDADRVIEILGFFAVNGHGRPASVILAALPGRGRNPGWEGAGLFQGLPGKYFLELMPADDDPCVHSRVVRHAEKAGDATRIPFDFDDHPGPRGMRALGRQRNLVRQRRIQREKKGLTESLRVDSEE